MPGETARSEAQRVEATRHCSRRTETRNLIASFCIESPSSILWIWYASFRRSSLGSSVDCTRTCVGGSRGVVGRAGCALQISRMPAYSRLIPPTSPPGSRVVGDGGWFTVYPPRAPSTWTGPYGGWARGQLIVYLATAVAYASVRWRRGATVVATDRYGYGVLVIAYAAVGS